MSLEKEDLIFYNSLRERERTKETLRKIKKKLAEEYIRLRVENISKGNKQIYKKIKK
jgi:hypothetical protein